MNTNKNLFNRNYKSTEGTTRIKAGEMEVTEMKESIDNVKKFNKTKEGTTRIKAGEMEVTEMKESIDNSKFIKLSEITKIDNGEYICYCENIYGKCNYRIDKYYDSDSINKEMEFEGILPGFQGDYTSSYKVKEIKSFEKSDSEKLCFSLDEKDFVKNSKINYNGIINNEEFETIRFENFVKTYNDDDSNFSFPIYFIKDKKIVDSIMWRILFIDNVIFPVPFPVIIKTQKIELSNEIIKSFSKPLFEDSLKREFKKWYNKRYCKE